MVLGALVGYVVASAVFPTLLWTHVVSIFLVAGLAMLLVDPAAAWKSLKARIERFDPVKRRYLLWSSIAGVAGASSLWVYTALAVVVVSYGPKLFTPDAALQDTMVFLFGSMFVAVPALIAIQSIGRFFDLTDSWSSRDDTNEQLLKHTKRYKEATARWNPVAAPFTLVFGFFSKLPNILRWLAKTFVVVMRYVLQNILLALLAGFALGWCVGAWFGNQTLAAGIGAATFFVIAAIIWAVDSRVNSNAD